MTAGAVRILTDATTRATIDIPVVVTIEDAVSGPFLSMRADAPHPVEATVWAAALLDGARHLEGVEPELVGLSGNPAMVLGPDLPPFAATIVIDGDWESTRRILGEIVEYATRTSV